MTKTGGGTASYVYLDLQLVASAAGEEYLYGPGLDAVLALTKGGKVDYYSTAALSSVSVLSDAAGNVDASYVTDAWGRLVGTSGTSTNAFGYTGREFNEDGTYYYRARYYDPRIGRFTSEDPAYYVGELYAYVDGAPVAQRDPSGLGGGKCDCKKPKDQDGYDCSPTAKFCREQKKVNEQKTTAEKCTACLACCDACVKYARDCGHQGPEYGLMQKRGCEGVCTTHCYDI